MNIYVDNTFILKTSILSKFKAPPNEIGNPIATQNATDGL